VLIGNRLNRMIPPGRFDRYIHILLILVGVIFFIRTVILYGAGGCVEVWAPSWTPQIVNLHEYTVFQSLINNAPFFHNCDM
jgi:hypothetical protein